MKTLRALSLDVSLGAVISSAFVAKIMGIVLAWNILLVLGVTVWVIYSIDHLIDARAIKGKAQFFRHRFHQIHFKKIIVFILFALMLNAIIVMQLDMTIVYAGASLLTIIGIYFVLLYHLQKIKHPFKEFTGAGFYSLGVFIGPMTVTGFVIDHKVAVVFLLYFLLAYINLQTISFYEKDKDDLDGMASFANYFGPQFLSKFLILISILYFTILFFAHLVYEMKFLLLVLFFLMGLTSVCIILFNSFFREEEKYRIYGDLVFLLPVLLLLNDSV